MGSVSRPISQSCMLYGPFAVPADFASGGGMAGIAAAVGIFAYQLKG